MNSKLKEIFGPNFNISDIEFSSQTTSNSILTVESLENDKVYKALKNEVNLYFSEKKKPLEKQTLHKDKSFEWKEQFYTALQALMNEIIFTNSNQMRKTLLNKIVKWYTAKCGRSPVPESRNYHYHSHSQDQNKIFIPQKIESTVEVKKHVVTPFIPTKAEIKPQESHTNFLNVLLKTEENSANFALPKVRNLHTRAAVIRPYSQLKGTQGDEYPVVKDFRASTRAKSTSMTRNQSPDTLNNPSFYSSIKNTTFDSGMSYLRVLQIKEVMDIKKRMAGRRVVCPIKVLEGGLIISDYGKDFVSPEDLPKGGELLMHDPFDQPSKGKKKKRKTKKK